MSKKNLQLVGNGERSSKKKSPSNSLKMSIDDMITIDAKTENQGQFMSQYYHKPAFLLHGCAGTGKTFIAMYRALEEVLDKGTPFERVIVVRSAVPSRDIGHLPGSLDEKTDIYSLPYQAMCKEFFPTKQQPYQRLVEQKYLEFMSTSYIRGITLEHAVIIIDECQNLTDMEINSIMTRAGVSTKVIFCGDFRQTDLFKRHDMSGLKQFMLTVDAMPSFCSVEFGVEDIVRSALVREYIEARMKFEDNNHYATQ